MTARWFIRLVFLVNLGLAVVSAILCLAFAGRDLAVGAAAGGLLGSANVLALGGIAVRMFSPEGTRGRVIVLLVLKVLALGGLGFLAVGVLTVSGPGLAIGVSTTVVAVLSASAIAVTRGGGVRL